MIPGAPRPPVTVRTAQPEDLPVLAALETAGFPPNRAWSAPLLRLELEAPGALMLLAEGPDGIVGYAAFRTVADESELLRLAVHPDARRRGIGRALVRAGLAASAVRGARRCFLEVRLHNRAAINLYRALGFRDAGRRQGYYRDGDDALVMSRSTL